MTRANSTRQYKKSQLCDYTEATRPLVGSIREIDTAGTRASLDVLQDILGRQHVYNRRQGLLRDNVTAEHTIPHDPSP